MKLPSLFFFRIFIGFFLIVTLSTFSLAQWKPRARDLGIPFEGAPGPLNAITDVSGVEVGHRTLISGKGRLEVGKGPIRTGVTAVLPRGKQHMKDPVFAGWFSLNGNGEMTGTTWVEESGFLYGPVMITNTHSVGVVRDAVIAWTVKNLPADSDDWWSLPVVAETWDGFLNDINGFHVKELHVFQALENSRAGKVQEGAVGGGTGMVCYGFKGGIGTSSRVVEIEGNTYTVGVLVQANFGRRNQLLIAGVPVGKEIPDSIPYASNMSEDPGDLGSIIVIIATDAPLMAHQTKRLARRASLGVARTGGTAMNGSGDIFIAFSTSNPGAAKTAGLAQLVMLPNEQMNPLMSAAAYATEEAIINALVAGESMIGINDREVIGLPYERVREILRGHNRLLEPVVARFP